MIAWHLGLLQIRAGLTSQGKAYRLPHPAAIYPRVMLSKACGDCVSNTAALDTAFVSRVLLHVSFGAVVGSQRVVCVGEVSMFAQGIGRLGKHISTYYFNLLSNPAACVLAAWICSGRLWFNGVLSCVCFLTCQKVRIHWYWPAPIALHLRHFSVLGQFLL